MVTDLYQARVDKFAALGDTIRLSIVDLLQDQDLSPDALAAALDLPGNLLAHHVNVLTGVGIIERTRSAADGRRTYLRLDHAVFTDLLPAAGQIKVPRVVFACTENSARSVLAELLWREVSEVPVISAGTKPADRINPRTRTVARRAKLLLDQREPRALDDVLKPTDLLVCVCDAVNEQILRKSNRRLHWSIPDPALIGTDEAFGDALMEIRARVNHLAPRIMRSTTNRKGKVSS